MRDWLNSCENWVLRQYQKTLGLEGQDGSIRLRWLPSDSLTKKVEKKEAYGLAIEDSEIGWILYLLPYETDRMEQQVNQALGVRSRLLRESNYTGNGKPGDNDDKDGSWRVELVWLVKDSSWDDWQQNILELRRESGVAEEISFDAIRIIDNDVEAALDENGLPRLLLYTRALLMQTLEETETWLSADKQVISELKEFSQQFDTPRARTFARELEKKAKSFESKETELRSTEPRQFRRFLVKHFRNLDTFEVVSDKDEAGKAQAIILFGPNGTGKSSIAEAISLAAFGTSPRLEEFLIDRDVARSSTDIYLKDYLTPIENNGQEPRFAWDNGIEYKETPFDLDHDEKSRLRYEGVVLNQEDSIKFTDLSRGELAARVLTGYSALADELSMWLEQEERKVNDAKREFTRKHGLNSAIKLSATAYNRLAQTLLSEQLKRPSPEFIDWLHFLGRLSDEDGQCAATLVSDWQRQQDSVINRLADTLAKFQEKGVLRSNITQAIQEKLGEYGVLAGRSVQLHKRMEGRIVALREQLEGALTQIEAWGAWLVAQKTSTDSPKADGDALKIEIEKLSKERGDLEKNGKALRDRLNLLDQAKQFLTSHWASQHPDICPVCDSNVSNRQGIEAVVSNLQKEINTTIETLRTRYAEIQSRQKELDNKLKAVGIATCPLSSEDQARLKAWLMPFLPEGVILEDWLISPQRRQQLKGDLSRMGILPEAPKPYADAAREAERLATEFIALTQQADRALEDPQAIGEVKKAFERSMERILIEHLPSTLGKVWEEITLTLTTAPWLLPARPALKLEQRGKSLSVRADKGDRYIRYIFNAAERHVLGLAWFFTHYLARRRFEEGWILLDDPAQEMDQPSFRELVRLWETLIRLHNRKNRPFTMIIALHQEERALDAARATNGRLYILGWQKQQEGLGARPSVKKVVLLAPGFHPLKPEKIFSE